jgi:endonuclease/exonuclease/phosphatase family metal-dependent hydrolase
MPVQFPSRLTVMTYNIAQAVGQDNVESLPRIAQVIRASKADVVALQEVAYDLFAGDQGVRLARMLGMHVAVGYKLGVWHTGPGHPDRPYGLVILSRHPITAVRHRVLPASRSDQRELLQADIEMDGRRITVATTHPTATSPERRAAQLAAVHAAVSELRQPLVLVGDFNDTPDKDTIRPFAAAFTDACATWREPTFPSEKPVDRIDYIFAGRGFRVRSAGAVDTQASDHRPVVAQLALPG